MPVELNTAGLKLPTKLRSVVKLAVVYQRVNSRAHGLRAVLRVNDYKPPMNKKRADIACALLLGLGKPGAVAKSKYC